MLGFIQNTILKKYSIIIVISRCHKRHLANTFGSYPLDVAFLSGFIHQTSNIPQRSRSKNRNRVYLINICGSLGNGVRVWTLSLRDGSISCFETFHGSVYRQPLWTSWRMACKYEYRARNSNVVRKGLAPGRVAHPCHVPKPQWSAKWDFGRSADPPGNS